MVLESVKVVVACAGGGLQCAHLARGLKDIRGLPQEEFVERLPDVARAAVDAYKIDSLSTVVFAGYSHERGRAFGGAFLTHVHGGPTALPKGQSYQVLDRKALLIPPVPGLPLAPLVRPTAFNPYTNSLGIIEQQRRFNFGSPGKPVGCCIAGDVDVVSVGKNGFTIETIHHYPAQIGEKVVVERTALDDWLERQRPAVAA
jgi:hypothetical protein